MKLPHNCLLIFALSLAVVIAKRRRVPFMKCPASKSDSDLIITKRARSRIECSKFCLDDPRCLSASYCKTTDGHTCQLSGLYASGSCAGFVPDADCIQTALVDPCENGGTFFPENRTCQCVEGFVGVYCQRRPRELYDDLATGQYDIVFSWLQLHMGIKGNRMADAAAKTALNKSVTPLLIPYSDYKPVIRCHIGDLMQKKWDTQADCTETEKKSHTFYLIEPLKSGQVFRWSCVGVTTRVTYINEMISNITTPRSWQQFKEGLSPISWPLSTFTFCGLEYLHQLTSQGMYDMYVFLIGTGFKFGKLWYRNFRVDSEANGYSLYWDQMQLDPGYTDSYQYLDGLGGAGNASKNLNGARFGTFDNDVNGCANANNAGWWYNPLGCTALKFEEAGWSWPTNRSGIVKTELLVGVLTGIHSVFWYTEDDLVLSLH